MSQYANTEISKLRDDQNSSWAKTFALIPDGSTVLDVGCSAGIFGEELMKKKHCVVDGVEIDDGDFKLAQKKLRKVYKYNIETDELKLETKYGVIFMGDVVEHLARPVPALKKLRELLEANGKLVFSIPNITHMSVRLMLLEGKIEYGKTGLLDETHLHFYNQEEVMRVFNEAGFKVEQFDYTVNDLPFALARDKLAKLGLTPNDKFKELLGSANAVAYQFVGAAVRGDGGRQKPLPASSPHNIVGTYIDELKKDYDRTITKLQQHVQNVSEDRDRIIKDRDRIQTELNRSLAGHLIRYAKKIKHGKRGA